MVEEVGHGLALRAPLRPSAATTEECGDIQRAREVVHTDASEVELTAAQGMVLALPEVGDLHL